MALPSIVDTCLANPSIQLKLTDLDVAQSGLNLDAQTEGIVILKTPNAYFDNFDT